MDDPNPLSVESLATEPEPRSPHPPATVFGTQEELPRDELARRIEAHAKGMRKRT